MEQDRKIGVLTPTTFACVGLLLIFYDLLYVIGQYDNACWWSLLISVWLGITSGAYFKRDRDWPGIIPWDRWSGSIWAVCAWFQFVKIVVLI